MTETSFWGWVKRDLDRVALIDAEGRSSSFRDLHEESNRLSHAMADLGIKRGDSIAIVLPNCREFISLYLAAIQSGLYLVPINWHLTRDEIAFIMDDSESRAVFASERYAKAVEEAADSLDFPREFRFSVGTITEFRSFEELLDDPRTEPPQDRSAGQVMFYTSGTTGRPKGVRRRLSQRSVEDSVVVGPRFFSMFGIEPGAGVHLVPGPMYHSAPLAWGTTALHIGHTVVLMDKWSPQATLELIERYRVTEVHLVPTMFQRMLALPDEGRKKYDVSSLRMVAHAAAPCPAETKLKMYDWLGPIIWEYYGSTEGGGTIVSPKEWLEHPGTVGRKWPNSDIKILDDEGNECPHGVPGTIYIRAGRTSTFEYFKDNQKTNEGRKGSYFTVGDVGYLDEGGWLYLNDRKIDMIISGGVNIYPAEVEAVLITHPKVTDVAVLGIPDEEWGEQVKAVVQPAEGVEPSEDLAHELIGFCRSKLAHYKCPRSVDFRSELPRYTTGKLYKRLIRDEYWQGIEKKI